HWLTGEGWYPGKPPGPKIPYRLPELLTSDTQVVIVEGEKHADKLAASGVITTTASEGAGKWTEDLAQHFKGRDVIILPDNDEPGRNHATSVATNLHGVAARIRIVELPGLPRKGDISDWLDAGNTIEQLNKLIAAAPDWRPGGSNLLPLTVSAW